MKKVKLESLVKMLVQAAQREQDMSIGDRANFWAHAFAHVRLLGVAEFVEALRKEGAEIFVSDELAQKLGVETEDVAA